MVAIQVQIQAPLTDGAAARGGGEATKVAKLQTFDGTSLKISRFITACRLYIRMRMRETVVEKQIQ